MTFLLPILLRWGLSQRVAGVLAWVIPVVASVALLGGLYALLTSSENADDQHNQNIGAEMQRASDMAQTIDNVEKANAAADEVHRSTDAARDECMRNARNPANC